MTLSLEYIKIANIAIIVYIIINILVGIKRGILWAAIKTLGMLAASLLAYIVSPGLAGAITIYPESWTPFKDSAIFEVLHEKLNMIAWFVIVFVLVCLILLFIRPLFKAISEKKVVKTVDGILGAVFSLITSYCMLVIITFVMNTALITNGKDFIANSYFKYIDSSSKVVTKVFDKIFSQNQAIQKMLSDPLSLTTDDLQELVKWMKDNQLSTESITSFFEKYGIDVTKINDLLKNLEETNE